MAALLEQRWNFDAATQFIHADIHLGNVLKDGDTYTCMDFDECGFGPLSFDIGAVRLHPIAHGYIEEVWPASLEGYGAPLVEEDIRLGTALRFFYMTGKIPLRLDHPDLRHQPEERIRRYLGYAEGELEAVM